MRLTTTTNNSLPTLALLLTATLTPLTSAFNCANPPPNGCYDTDAHHHGFSLCLITTYGISPLLHCASQSPPAAFTAISTSGKTHDLSASAVLQAAFLPRGKPNCPAEKLGAIIAQVASQEHPGRFFERLCARREEMRAQSLGKESLDDAVCRLREGFVVRGSGEREHSLDAVCDGKVDELMQAPELAEGCARSGSSSDESSGGSSGGSSSGSSDTSSVSVLFYPTRNSTASYPDSAPSATVTASATSTAAAGATAVAGGPAFTPRTQPGAAAGLESGIGTLERWAGMGFAILLGLMGL